MRIPDYNNSETEEKYKMVNYKDGKIYKIVSSQTAKIYIGSTTKKYLSQRMDDHRSMLRHSIC